MTQYRYNRKVKHDYPVNYLLLFNSVHYAMYLDQIVIFLRILMYIIIDAILSVSHYLLALNKIFTTT